MRADRQTNKQTYNRHADHNTSYPVTKVPVSRASTVKYTVIIMSSTQCRKGCATLSPIHISNNVEATLSNATSRTMRFVRQSRMLLLQHCCRFRQQCFRFRLVAKTGNIVTETENIVAENGKNVKQYSTLSKGRNFTINSFNIVVIFRNKVERCFDITAGGDGALHYAGCDSRWRHGD